MNTGSGPVTGLLTSQGRAYLGVPYAQPPVGALRWRPPVPPTPWTVSHDATRTAPVCPQHPVSFQQGAASPTLVGTEDCLYLNVQVPPEAVPGAALPVMVWIHGGEFVTGSGGAYDGTLLAQRQHVIVVTLNYRLGPLGFLAAPSLSRESETGTSGNYGLMDQQAALAWVHRNIAAFGGDPGNVTVFGESAGGMSICSQLASPLAAGLFQKAIVQSGLCGSPNNTLSRWSAEDDGLRFARALGCGHAEPDCLRGKSPEALLSGSVPGVRPLGALTWAPVYGDQVVPVPPLTAFREGIFNKVPVMNGTNADEGRLFVAAASFGGQGPALEFSAAGVLMFGPSQGLAAAQQYPSGGSVTPAQAFSSLFTDAIFACPAADMDAALAPHVPTFAYEFRDPQAATTLTAPADLGTLGAFHASEIAYIFQTPNAAADPLILTPQQQALSDRMQAAWGTFARTGNPGVDWGPVTPTALPVHTFTPDGDAPDPQFASLHHCDFWRALRTP